MVERGWQGSFDAQLTFDALQHFDRSRDQGTLDVAVMQFSQDDQRFDHPDCGLNAFVVSAFRANAVVGAAETAQHLTGLEALTAAGLSLPHIIPIQARVALAKVRLVELPSLPKRMLPG